MELKCAKDYYTLVPDGIYKVQCIGTNRSPYKGIYWKTFLNFVILDEGEFSGKELFMAFNTPENGKFSPGSKYFKTYVMVNGWNKPSRGSDMSPKIFLNKMYRIKTRTVKPPKSTGEEMPENFWYSIVAEIVEVLLE